MIFEKLCSLAQLQHEPIDGLASFGHLSQRHSQFILQCSGIDCLAADLSSKVLHLQVKAL